jgi:hypothetical protein
MLKKVLAKAARLAEFLLRENKAIADTKADRWNYPVVSEKDWCVMRKMIEKYGFQVFLNSVADQIRYHTTGMAEIIEELEAAGEKGHADNLAAECVQWDSFLTKVRYTHPPQLQTEQSCEIENLREYVMEQDIEFSKTRTYEMEVSEDYQINLAKLLDTWKGSPRRWQHVVSKFTFD